MKSLVKFYLLSVLIVISFFNAQAVAQTTTKYPVQIKSAMWIILSGGVGGKLLVEGTIQTPEGAEKISIEDTNFAVDGLPGCEPTCKGHLIFDGSNKIVLTIEGSRFSKEIGSVNEKGYVVYLKPPFSLEAEVERTYYQALSGYPKIQNLLSSEKKTILIHVHLSPDDYLDRRF